ncbi:MULTISPECIES: hypothetical protein [Mesorhizobium]|uniref:hypothetical protein n=1 Tax=unclassified Mesorhizobium TaxID=325217 RepID=UPI001FCCC9C5|nr:MULTISPECIES: hypothetical protein [Mesorhizobium]MDF3233843.1 hypothetical protein [Mesorhizobium sp. DSM 30133]
MHGLQFAEQFVESDDYDFALVSSEQFERLPQPLVLRTGANDEKARNGPSVDVHVVVDRPFDMDVSDKVVALLKYLIHAT